MKSTFSYKAKSIFAQRKNIRPRPYTLIKAQWRIQGGGLVGVQTPHDRTDENFQHRIKKWFIQFFVLYMQYRWHSSI